MPCLQAIRSSLKSVPNVTIKAVLEFNGMSSRGGDITIQQRLADAMLHGVPDECPKCSSLISYSDGQYTCGGAFDEYSKCLYKEIEHPRKPFLLPKGGLGNEYLAEFKFSKVAIPKALVKHNAKTAEAVEKKKEAIKEQEAKAEEREKAKYEVLCELNHCNVGCLACWSGCPAENMGRIAAALTSQLTLLGSQPLRKARRRTNAGRGRPLRTVEAEH